MCFGKKDKGCFPGALSWPVQQPGAYTYSIHVSFKNQKL